MDTAALEAQALEVLRSTFGTPCRFFFVHAESFGNYLVLATKPPRSQKYWYWIRWISHLKPHPLTSAQS